MSRSKLLCRLVGKLNEFKGSINFLSKVFLVLILARKCMYSELSIHCFLWGNKQYFPMHYWHGNLDLAQSHRVTYWGKFIKTTSCFFVPSLVVTTMYLQHTVVFHIFYGLRKVIFHTFYKKNRKFIRTTSCFFVPSLVVTTMYLWHTVVIHIF